MTTDHDRMKAMADALEEISKDCPPFALEDLGTPSDYSTPVDYAGDVAAHCLAKVGDKARAALALYRAQAEEPKYRMLERGEEIMDGDEYQAEDSEEWVPTICAGQHVLPEDIGFYRRPITPDAR